MTRTSTIKKRSRQSIEATPKTKYFVASQDEELLDVLRGNGCVPVIRLARGSVLLLEQPSKVASVQASQEERKKWTVAGSVSEQERILVATVRDQQRQQQQQKAPLSMPRRQHKKAKGPNPLSCKRKKDEKTTNSSGTGEAGNSRKAKRRRKNKGGEVSQAAALD